jgi:hypothetical protein
MADTSRDSGATYSRALKGLWIGAIVGAVLANVVGMLLGMINIQTGGPGLHAMAGAAFGGFAGFMTGLIASRR